MGKKEYNKEEIRNVGRKKCGSSYHVVQSVNRPWIFPRGDRRIPTTSATKDD